VLSFSGSAHTNKKGHPESYYYAGKLVQRGRGTSGLAADGAAGLELIRCALAHDRTLARAHTALAHAELLGTSGTPVDPSAATQKLRQAAQLGYPKAQFNLGVLLERQSVGGGGPRGEGEEVPTTTTTQQSAAARAEAVAWWAQAARSGHPGAMHNLALRYMQKGRFWRHLPGMPKTDAAAVALWRAAAEQKHGPSLCCLGCLVEVGRAGVGGGVGSAGGDRVRALELHQQALDVGHEPSRAHVERLQVPRRAELSGT
jgi:TPR repeat protein